MLAELLATEGVQEICELRSRVGVMAFHGGSLEVMTDIIAAEVAERAGASLYAIRQPRGFRWHIPSHAIDPAESPTLEAFIGHVDHAIALHGWGTDGNFRLEAADRPILVGGRNRELAARVAAVLREALPSYEIIDDLEQMPPKMRGLDRRNLVNRVRNTGVQLELTPRVRGLPPYWDRDKIGLACPDTATLVDALASCC